MRERIEEIVVPRYVEEERPAPAKPRVFHRMSDSELLAYGVPAEWLVDARDATENSLLDLVAHLPAEVAETLLNLAIGIKPQPSPEGLAHLIIRTRCGAFA